MITISDTLYFFDNFNVTLFERYKIAKMERAEIKTKHLSVRTIPYTTGQN